MGKAASALAQIKTVRPLSSSPLHVCREETKQTKSHFDLAQVGTIGILSQMAVGFQGAVLGTAGGFAASPASAQQTRPAHPLPSPIATVKNLSRHFLEFLLFNQIDGKYQ